MEWVARQFKLTMYQQAFCQWSHSLTGVTGHILSLLTFCLGAEITSQLVWSDSSFFC